MTYLEKVKFCENVRNHRMKWGVRRYQNDDGTMTPEGRKRYHSGDDKMMKPEVIAKINSRVEELAEKDERNGKLNEPRELKDWQWEIMLRNESKMEDRD